MSDSQKWLILAAVAGSGWLLYLLAPVLTPFLLAAILAYVGDPLVDRLEARGFSRTWAVVTVFSLLTIVGLALLVILLPMLGRQIESFTGKLPDYIDWIKDFLLPRISELLGVSLDAWKDVFTQLGGSVGSLVSTLTSSGVALVAWVANLFLVPVVTFYLLRDWDILVEHIRRLLPRRVEPTVVLLSRRSDEVLGAFLRGQLMVMAALATIYSIGLWLVGLEFSLLVGLLAGAVSFVPYLGFIVGIAVAGVLAAIQFHDATHLLYVAGVFGVGQLLEGVLLTPLLVGDRIGLHPVAVIFAVLAGGQLFGFFGILLALPVAAVVMVLLRYLHERYLESRLYRHEMAVQELSEVDGSDGG